MSELKANQIDLNALHWFGFDCIGLDLISIEYVTIWSAL